MGWLDQVQGIQNLYIGGLFSLRRHDAVQSAGITHVVSVMRGQIDENITRPFKHLQIEVDDDESENLLQYFPVTNKFIQDALDYGGSVLVHCAMGKSRSATVVLAYMMHTLHLSPDDALAQLRESRGVCEPNSGFSQQLKVYHSMNAPASVEDKSQYQKWMYQCELEQSRAVRQAPEATKIRFEDEHMARDNTEGLALKCRRCRQLLSTSQYFVSHEPKQNLDAARSEKSLPVPPSACSHYFVEALSWMRPELEQGKLEGRLECPKCSNNVGKYAWQGMQCSCGDWVIPGISLAKARIDEVRLTSDARANNAAIRLPPGSKSLGNL